MERRSQGATEYLLMLAAILLVVGAIVYSISTTSSGLGSSVGDEIENLMENTIIPGLVRSALI